MNNSPTPRVDALFAPLQQRTPTVGDLADLARQLERELAALREALAEALPLVEEYARVEAPDEN